MCKIYLEKWINELDSIEMERYTDDSGEQNRDMETSEKKIMRNEWPRQHLRHNYDGGSDYEGLLPPSPRDKWGKMSD